MSASLPIIVVGGGIAGLATALAAAPAPVMVLNRGQGATGAASVLARSRSPRGTVKLKSVMPSLLRFWMITSTSILASATAHRIW